MRKGPDRSGKPTGSVAEDLPPKSLDDWLKLIATLSRLDRERALDVCRQAIGALPECAPLHKVGGNLLLSLKRLEEADSWISTALRLQPRDVSNLRVLGRLRMRQGRIEEALQAFESALAIKNSAEIQAECGQMLLDVGEFAAAAKRFKLAIARDPRPDWIRARARAEQLNHHQAALGLTPEGQRTLRRAMDHLRHGQAGAAESLFVKVVAAAPGSASAWSGLRGALEVQGVPDVAGRLNGVLAGRADAEQARDTAMKRRLSRRGLVFDPRGPFRIRRNSEALTTVAASQDLRHVDNSLWVMDPGGKSVEHDPVISLDPSGNDRLKVSYRSQPKSVAALSDVALAGVGILLDATGAVLADFLQDQMRAKHYPGSTRTTLALDPTTFLDGAGAVQWVDQPALLMTGHTDMSFGDWLWNFPPRLAFAEAAGLDLPLVVSSRVPSHFLDILFALGGDRGRVILHDPATVMVFRRLYTPSWIMADRRTPAEGWAAIYDRFRDRPATPGPPLIYVSRRSIAKRPLLNEAELCDLFASRGFEIVEPQTLTLADALRIFADPRCVAGPYGSGLRNVVFCRRTPVMFVVMPPYAVEFDEGSAIWLAEMGVRFGWVKGRPALGHAGGAPNQDPWEVSIEEAARKLDRLLSQIG